MKTMNNFAAQQLTKKQMNDVKGGGGGLDNCGILFYCAWSGGSNYFCSKDTKAMDHLFSLEAPADMDCRIV